LFGADMPGSDSFAYFGANGFPQRKTSRLSLSV
jgi:hypothetical protein